MLRGGPGALLDGDSRPRDGSTMPRARATRELVESAIDSRRGTPRYTATPRHTASRVGGETPTGRPRTLTTSTRRAVSTDVESESYSCSGRMHVDASSAVFDDVEATSSTSSGRVVVVECTSLDPSSGNESRRRDKWQWSNARVWRRRASKRVAH